MNSFVKDHYLEMKTLTDVIIEKQADVTGILVHGSAVKKTEPRDLDLLIIVNSDLKPAGKRNIRGRIAREIRKSVDLDIDIEIRIQTLKRFSILSPLHFGVIDGYMILHDPSGTLKTALKKVEEISKIWKTRRIGIDDGSWVILPKGRAFLKEPLEYDITLI